MVSGVQNDTKTAGHFCGHKKSAELTAVRVNLKGVCGGTYRIEGLLPAVGVHGRHDVDAGGGDEARHVLVALLVQLAHLDRQLQQQLATYHLVAVHVAHPLELRLHCNVNTRDQGETDIKSDKKVCLYFPFGDQNEYGTRAVHILRTSTKLTSS